MKKNLIALSILLLWTVVFTPFSQATDYDLEDQLEFQAYQEAKAANPNLTPAEFDAQQDLLEDQRERAAYQAQMQAQSQTQVQTAAQTQPQTSTDVSSSQTQVSTATSGDVIEQTLGAVDFFAQGTCELNGQIVPCQELYQQTKAVLANVPFVNSILQNPAPLLTTLLVIAVISAIIGLLSLVFRVMMLVDAFQNEEENRFLWLIILIITGIIGAIVYYFLVKRPRSWAQKNQKTETQSRSHQEIVDID